MHYSNKKFSLKIIFSLSFVLFFISVKLIAQPLAVDAGPDQTICNGSSTPIGGSPTANFGTPGYTYSWAPAAGLSSTTVSNPTANPTVTTTYTITVVDAFPTTVTDIVTITVNPLPVISPVPTNVTVCHGTFQGSTTFSSLPGGATINWTNSNPSIGIAASGVGFIPSYTATNTGTTPQVATITLTPTLAGCTGPSSNYTITVNPRPVGTTTPTSQTLCSGVACNFVSSSTVAGTTYTWAAFGSGVTGHSAGSGSVIAQSVSTTSASTGGVTYTVTPTAAGCVGTNMIVNLTVKPNPVATATTSPLTRCSGDTVSFSVSCPVPSTTYTWVSFATNTSGADASGTGSSVFDTLTTTTTSPGTMTYIFTPTAAGCVGSQAFPFVNVNPMPIAAFSYVSPACQNTPNIFPTFGPGASAGTFTTFPAGMVIDPSTGEIDLTSSTPGGYSITNTIPAGGGCPSTNANTGFSIEPFLDPTITDITYVCYGDAPFNFVAATTGGTWSGVGITNTALGTFDPTPAGLGTYTITYTSPGPCFYSDVTNITVVAGDINGNVTYSGGPLNSGTNTAVLFNYSSTFATFDTAQTCTLDAFGNYNFSSVYPGDYLIEIYADTLVYPLAVPTYYTSEYLWDTATVLTHNCVNSTADVFVIEGVVTAGPGSISGFVTEGYGFVRAPGDPIPGLDVKLGKNPGGSMVTNTQTTSPFGAYGFFNLPINSPGEYYTVYVDIPGLQRDSVWNITVTATNTIFTNINYEADSNSVYPIFPVVTSMVSGETDHSLTVYPNPTNTSSTVEYTLTNSSSVKLEVMDVLGKQLQLLVNTNQPAGNYKVNLAKLNAGIYFIKLNINNQTNTTRLVVTD